MSTNGFVLFIYCFLAALCAVVASFFRICCRVLAEKKDLCYNHHGPRDKTAPGGRIRFIGGVFDE